MSTRPIVVKELGRQPYVPIWQAMQAYTDERDADSDDELWLLQHDPVYTQGLAGKSEHVLMPGDIPIVHTDRGGQVTYHGPGQLVMYPLINLERRRLGVRALVCALEQLVIDWLASHDVVAERREGAPGVYVAGAKIASLGLKVRRGCSYHGLAINVDMDLSPFERINPCGLAGQPMTQVKALLPDLTVEAVEQALLTAFCQQLGYHLTP